MRYSNARTPARRNQGMALIVALILLMVLTMIAVIAMRTTTLDLKMTANQTLSKRTFQASEAGRARIWQILNDHNFHRGWPTSVGGTVPASSGFVIPPEITIDLPLKELYIDISDHWDMTAAARDMALRIDGDGDLAYISPEDMASDLFISRMASVAAAGTDTSQVSGYEGLGSGQASGGAHLYFRLISRAAGAGATQATTEALYRYVILQ